MNHFQTVSAGMLTLMPLMSALPGTAVASPIQAATPSDANASGTETIVSTEQNTTYIQGGVQVEQNLFHHFDSFNVEAGHTANFVTAEPTAAVIGQVSGGSRSHIDGTLQITGSEADLYLLNPAGVLFGPNAHLNLGGSFTATTASQVGFGEAWLTVEHTVENAPDYSAFDRSPSAYRFEDAAAIVNQADLSVAEGEAIRFVGGGVANTGTLSAPGGEVTLSAVERDRLVRLTAEGSLLSVEVDAAMGSGFGKHTLPELLTGQGETATDATDLRVNSDGSVTLLSHEGEPAVTEGAVFSAGRVDAAATEAGERGGQINLLGSSVTVEGAQLSADGPAGGGLIRVGGDYQGQGTLPAAEQVLFEGAASADALVSGDGGQVVLWSEGTTQFSGLLSAQGAGEGEGGLVETSGLAQLVVDARSQVTTAAPSGDFGTWLLDPVDLSVVAGGGTATIVGGTNSPAAASTVDAATLVSALDGSNVTLQATNSVTVDAPIDASGNAAGGDLFFQTPTLNLNESIVLRAGSLLSGQPTTVNVGANGLIQNAVDAVATGGTVNLAAATYQGAETIITRDMTLRGQGAGSTLLTGDSVRRVVRIDGGIVGIDRVTILDGAADRGGGILVQNAASLLLTNSELIGNSALEPGGMTGGGLHLAGAGTSLIRDTRFENNTANDGGALSQNDTHDVLIQDSDFVNNLAQQDGGAIDNRTTNSGLTIRNSLFSANEALQEGGAIAIRDALFLSDSRLENNSATEAGAIFFRDTGTSSITRTTLDNNQSTSSAGAIALVDRHNLTIEQSTLSNNIAGSVGGAIASILSADANLDITNSTLSGNQATTAGGGLFIEPGRDVSLTNVTITDNQSGTGGGLSVAPSGSVELASSIVSGNMAVVNADIDGAIISQGNNIVGDRGASTGYVATDLPAGTDPRLGVLADNGGPTWTHALLLNSPAHDGGVGIGMDQRGVNASGLRDIGAYERLAPNSFVFTAGDGQSAVVDTAYADAVEVQVLDSLGGVLDGIEVTFSTRGSVAGSDVTFDRPAVLTTDTNGLVSMPIRANTVAGSVNVRAKTPALPRELIRVNNVADVPAQLTVTGGNNQSAVVNTAFADQISVEVSDRFGNIVQGARVDFSVPSTGPSGKLSDLFHITGSSGEGHTEVTANTLAGDFSVLAEVGALSTTVALRNLADAADQLVLSGHAAAVTAGDVNPFTVTALDQFGNLATGYSGTVAFSSSDAQAQLPANSLLTNGVGNFSSELRTAGIQSVTATDAINAGLTTTQGGIVVSPDVANRLDIVSGNHQSATVDTSFADDLVVQVQDRFGNGIAGEPITLLPAASGASGVPGNVAGATDAAGLFQTTLSANTVAGNHTLQANSGALSADFSLENLPDIAQHLVISGLLPVAITAGDSTGFTITAHDQFGNVATGYTGTLDFSSSDPQAQLPPPTVLTGGSGTFAGEPRTAGNHFLTVADTLDPALSVTQTGIVVVPDAPSELTVVSGDNQQAVVDTGFADGIVLQARDRFGNVTPGESIALSVPASGPSSLLSASTLTTNAQGQGVFTATANTVAGDHTVLAELGGLSQPLSLENLADVVSQLVLSGQPAAVTAGDVNAVTVTARDRFGNLADSYGGTVAISSSDGQAQLPETSVLTDGAGSFTTEFRTAGVQALSVVDTAMAGLGTTQEGIAVSHSVAHSLEIVGGSDQFAVASTDFPEALTVQVRDRFGNPVVGEPVTFLVPTAGPSAVLELATAVTDGSGRATTALSANDQVGVYIVEATTTGLRQVVGLTNTAPGSIPPASTLEVLPNNFFPEEEEGTERPGRLGLFDEVAFAQLEESLTEEYARYWQRPLKKRVDIGTVQQILQQAEETHQARSGIVYAVFVPPSEASGAGDARYSAALSRRLLSNEATEAQDELLLLFIPPEGDPVQQHVPVSRQQIQRLATFFNLEVSSFLNDGYKPLARELYSWLLEPIEEDIQKANVDDLMYVMDEGLSAVPLPAMMTGDTFAIERYGFSVLPSVGLLQTDFGSAPAEQTLLAGGADTFLELEALPAVPVELEIVESIATSAEVLLNEEFGVENLRTAQAIAPKTMMHVATHAAFNPGALDRSYIQFWDEQLTLDGLDSLGLEGLELLILSACTTATGSREAELGFAGLAAVTGVEASIGSLWQISDIGTMALMAEFYEQLQADPLRFSALRKAQLSLLRGDTRIEDNRLITQQGETLLPADLVSQGEARFSHPFFWSGFTLVGNPWW
ncbi:MAG: CHAT domain-containing protein [Cyanobacteria bacterium J06614_10]